MQPWRVISAVIVGHERVVEYPSPRSVAHVPGVDLDAEKEHTLDVLIVGGGPSRVAAAVYASAEGLSGLVVEEPAIGGQAAMFLWRNARHGQVLIRGDTLAESMSSYLSSRLEADPLITITIKVRSRACTVTKHSTMQE